MLLFVLITAKSFFDLACPRVYSQDYLDIGENIPPHFRLASFPGLLHLQFLIACSMQNRRGKAWEIFSCDPRHDRHTLSHLISTVKVTFKIVLAFGTSYEDGTSAN